MNVYTNFKPYHSNLLNVMRGLPYHVILVFGTRNRLIRVSIFLRMSSCTVSDVFIFCNQEERKSFVLPENSLGECIIRWRSWIKIIEGSMIILLFICVHLWIKLSAYGAFLFSYFISHLFFHISCVVFSDCSMIIFEKWIFLIVSREDS